MLDIDATDITASGLGARGGSAFVRYIIRQFLACKTRNPFFLALPNQVIGGQ
jgi:hypothetical protein